MYSGARFKRSELRVLTLATTVILFLICAQSVGIAAKAQSSGNSSISGTVHCKSSCSTVGLSDGAPVNVAGKVQAYMTMALDPTTCNNRPDLPTTPGQTTFDASAQGHYSIQNLLPGIYDLYASADGFQLTLVRSAIILCSGQSITQDAYILPIGAVPEFPSTLSVLVVLVFALGAVSLFSKRSRRAFAYND